MRVEFNQPAIVVGALALTAVNVKRMGISLTQAEEAANTLGRPTSRSLVDIVDARIRSPLFHNGLEYFQLLSL